MTLLKTRTQKVRKELFSLEKRFLRYASLKGKTEDDIMNMSNEDMDNLLFAFFPSIRKADGDHLKLNFLKSIRYGPSA